MPISEYIFRATRLEVNNTRSAKGSTFSGFEKYLLTILPASSRTLDIPRSAGGIAAAHYRFDGLELLVCGLRWRRA